MNIYILNLFGENNSLDSQINSILRINYHKKFLLLEFNLEYMNSSDQHSLYKHLKVLIFYCKIYVTKTYLIKVPLN